MRFVSYCLIVLANLWSSGLLPSSATNPLRAKKTRVLFIGNSFTYYNNMPRILEQIAPDVETRLIASGGTSLKDHWESQETRKAVRDGQWDYVVLQEQSSLAEVYLVNGKGRINSSRVFEEYARLWNGEIRAAGAKTVLVAHWADKDSPKRDQVFLDYAIVQTARSLKAIVAPVSLAWREAQQKGSQLYDEDGHHPSPAGSYLQACVLYALLTGADPTGLSAQAKGTAIEKGDGKVLTGTEVELVRLAPSDARPLQRAAWNAWKKTKALGGYPKVSRPDPLTLPRVSRGEQIVAPMLVGVWRGPLHVYPYPATLVLRFFSNRDQVRAEGKVSFGGRPDDIDFSIPATVIRNRELVFEDPKGPNGGVVRYRASLHNGVLKGIAEILVKRAPIYGIGEWHAKKEPSSN